MIKHADINTQLLFKKIRNKDIVLAGNQKLKIYGMLKCTSGKRMRKENRVFFSDEEEAIKNGYRACGHCLKPKYNTWSQGIPSEKKSILY